MQNKILFLSWKFFSTERSENISCNFWQVAHIFDSFYHCLMDWGQLVDHLYKNVSVYLFLDS